MSSYPPYNNDNPYTSSTQSSQPSGYYPSEQQSQYAEQQSQYSYPPQPVYQAPGYVPQYMAVPIVPMAVDDPGSGAALTGMILGIIGLFFPIVGIGGLIFSIIGMKSVTRKGMAVAGLITSIISVLEIVGIIALMIAAFTAAAAAGAAGG
ncbi:MAG TPA: DUF4190 domain-containing protein [Ktedonobacteraceae bacterium]|jgi:hypothetical protein